MDKKPGNPHKSGPRPYRPQGGKPAGTFARKPAGAAPREGAQSAEGSPRPYGKSFGGPRKYGKPVGAPRKYGRPVGTSETNAPREGAQSVDASPRSYGKPVGAPRRFDGPRKYGKPVGTSETGAPREGAQSVEGSPRPYGKSFGGPRKYGKPVGAPRRFDGPRKYGKPVGTSETGAPREGAQSVEGSPRSYGKPVGAPRRFDGPRKYGKPVGTSETGAPREGAQSVEGSPRSYDKPVGAPVAETDAPREGMQSADASREGMQSVDAPREGMQSVDASREGTQSVDAPREGAHSVDASREGTQSAAASRRFDGPRKYGKPVDAPREGAQSAAAPRKFDGPRKYGKPAGTSETDAPREGARPAHAPRTLKRVGSGMDARKLAYLTLSDVVRSEAYATLALGPRLAKSSLSPEDKRLTTQIFYTTIENLGRIDYVLKQFLARQPEPVIEDALRLAVAQILFMDKMPDHAVLNETVEMVKSFRPQLTGVVNGVLRNLLRARDEGTIVYPDKESDPIEYLSIMCSLPRFLAERLVADYGLDCAERIASYRPDERVQTVRPNRLRTNEADFAEWLTSRGFQWEKATVPGAFRIHGGGDLAGHPAFREGFFSLQGEASMLAALALAPKPAGNYLDACAAPGGKAALLGEMMNGAGRVQAWDVHAHRVELIRAAKERLHLDNLRPMERDATVPREELRESFDGVLIDAPCSGLGVLAGKPDIKLRLRPGDIESLVELQRKILDACAPYVKPGGLLVYSTCTVVRAENREQVLDFLARHPEYALETDAAYLPEALRGRVEDGMLQLLPHLDQTDGFFIARLRRRA